MKKTKPTPTYYAIIPAPVRYDNTLTDKPYKILYGELTTCSNIYGYCTVDNNKDIFPQVCEISRTDV